MPRFAEYLKSDAKARPLFYSRPKQLYASRFAAEISSKLAARLKRGGGSEPEKFTHMEYVSRYWKLLPKSQKAKCEKQRAANFVELKQLFDAWLSEQARAAQTARLQRASLCADFCSRLRRRPAAWLRRPSRL